VSAVLALLASLVWGTSDFVGGLTARRVAVRALVLCSSAVGLLTLVVVLSAAHLWQLDARSLGWGITGGLVGIAALGSFYRGLAIGPMGVVSPIAGVGVLVPFVGGLLRGEHPHTLQLAGALVAIAGVGVAAKPVETGTATRGRLLPVVLGLLSAVGFGMVLVSVQEGSEASVAMTLLWMRVASVTALGALALAQLRTRRRVTPWPVLGDIPALVVVGTFDLGANALFAVAGRGHLLSVVAVLSSLYPAVTALLAWRLLRERLGPIQTAGVGAIVVGVVLLAAS
jgi:drug/metabolite transporter (DMT)-like permease